MRMDRKAVPWTAWCGGVFVIATAAFIYCRGATRGLWDGGSWAGLAFGAAGFAAMLIAMLFAVRKKLRSSLLGRTYHWMQSHVWIGILSYPLVLYHAGGFSWGGPLTQTLMWILAVVFISGIVGIVLQQTIPVRLTRDVPAETIADQIIEVQAVLRGEAERVAATIRNSRVEPPLEAKVSVIDKTVMPSEPFASFYEQKIVAFLSDRFDSRSQLASPVSSRKEFESWRNRLDRSLHPATSLLESLVDERRQLAYQRRLHGWLHGWLLVHVPLSYGLMILAAIHAVMALRYMPSGR